VKGLIPCEYYFDRTLLTAEYERLFGRAWNFVGFTFDLANDNDYISVQVAGRPIIVQNFEGKLSAFLNVCSHRFSEIRCEAKGNGPLRCPNHGWTYNADGVPVGIPSRPRFEGMTEEMVLSLALPNYRVEVCGTLVFVTLDSAIPGLRQFLGDAWGRIEVISSSFGDMIDRNELDMKCNWKIAVENTLESYHVTFIHPKTFKLLGATGTDFRFERMHSAWYADVSETIEKQMAKLEDILRSRPFKVKGYVHQLVFPSLTIATTYGNSFAVQQITPTDVARTNFTSYVFATRLDGDNGTYKNVRAMINESVVQFNRAVFLEDKAICEGVQRGIRSGVGMGQMSDEELRVVDFQNNYAEMMGIASITRR